MTRTRDELQHFLARHISDWHSGWSMGTFGAIAEFHQDEGEPLTVQNADALEWASLRGGVRMHAAMLGEVRPVAYETISPRAHRWSLGVALCLPEALARRSQRTVLTELGPDYEAVREEDRGAILFDMGLGLPQSDFCIRTDNPELLDILRAAAGKSLFEPGNAAMDHVLSAHPHRVCVTNIGRVEVFQKIGGPDTGGVSPLGPHTHVLPQLLKGGRTHSANVPIPDGFMPCGHVHPGNAIVGPLGNERVFDETLLDASDAILQRFGLPHVLAMRATLETALQAAQHPAEFPEPAERHGRIALKACLRQKMARAQAKADHLAISQIQQWQSVFDRVPTSDSVEEEAPGH